MGHLIPTGTSRAIFTDKTEENHKKDLDFAYQGLGFDRLKYEHDKNPQL